MEDAEIVVRCLAGDREAFGMLVDRYQPGLLSLTWSLLGRREEAEDAAQDALLRAYARLGEFDHVHAFKSWLYAIAYKSCLDRLRHGAVERKYRPQAFESSAPSPLGPAEEKRLESASLLATHWGKLGFNERTALALAVVEGYSAAEIGRVLGCAESTARVHVFKAKSKLRDWLKGSSYARKP